MAIAEFWLLRKASERSRRQVCCSKNYHTTTTATNYSFSDTILLNKCIRSAMKLWAARTSKCHLFPCHRSPRVPKTCHLHPLKRTIRMERTFLLLSTDSSREPCLTVQDGLSPICLRLTGAFYADPIVRLRLLKLGKIEVSTCCAYESIPAIDGRSPATIRYG